MDFEHDYFHHEYEEEGFFSTLGKILRYFVAYNIILFGLFMAYVFCFNQECFMALASLAVAGLGVIYLAFHHLLYSYKVSTVVLISLGFYLYNL